MHETFYFWHTSFIFFVHCPPPLSGIMTTRELLPSRNQNILLYTLNMVALCFFEWWRYHQTSSFPELQIDLRGFFRSVRSFRRMSFCVPCDGMMAFQAYRHPFSV